MGLRDEIQSLYSEREHAIAPYVGEAFINPQPMHLRILALGINSYVTHDELRLGTKPEWWTWWWEHGSHPFFKMAREATRRVGQALEASTFFKGLQFQDPGCCYATNFIKSYLTDDIGKEADDVPFSKFLNELPIWRRELDLLAKHEALPHIVVVFGGVLWQHLWPSFLKKEGVAFQHFRPCSDERFVWQPDQPQHRFARYVVGTATREQPLLLMRLDHPSRGATPASLDTLLAAPDFRTVGGLSPQT